MASGFGQAKEDLRISSRLKCTYVNFLAGGNVKDSGAPKSNMEVPELAGRYHFEQFLVLLFQRLPEGYQQSDESDQTERVRFPEILMHQRQNTTDPKYKNVGIHIG